MDCGKEFILICVMVHDCDVSFSFGRTYQSCSLHSVSTSFEGFVGHESRARSLLYPHLSIPTNFSHPNSVKPNEAKQTLVNLIHLLGQVRYLSLPE